MNLKEKLAALYNDDSKHSNYQNIPDFVKEKLNYTETINESWRGDTARYKYLSEKIQLNKSMSIADVGANTGFFTLSFAYNNQDSIFYAYELNATHVAFMELIAEQFDLKNVNIYHSSLGLKEIMGIAEYDIVLLLNVLHHAGVDFDADMVSYDQAEFRKYLINYLSVLSDKAKILVFQIGYNWGGNKRYPLINLNDTAAMIVYLVDIFMHSNWEVKNIGVHTWENSIGFYKDMSIDFVSNTTKDALFEEIKKNMAYVNREGNSEFYNRPIFILQSKKTKNSLKG